MYLTFLLKFQQYFCIVFQTFSVCLAWKSSNFPAFYNIEFFTGLDLEHKRILKQLGLTPHQVSLQWVVESMQMSRPVPEGDFPAPSVAKPNSPSLDEDSILKAAMGPMPKMAKSSAPPPPPPAKNDDEDDDEDDLMAGEFLQIIF